MGVAGVVVGQMRWFSLVAGTLLGVLSMMELHWAYTKASDPVDQNGDGKNVFTYKTGISLLWGDVIYDYTAFDQAVGPFDNELSTSGIEVTFKIPYDHLGDGGEDGIKGLLHSCAQGGMVSVVLSAIAVAGLMLSVVLRIGQYCCCKDGQLDEDGDEKSRCCFKTFAIFTPALSFGLLMVSVISYRGSCMDYQNGGYNLDTGPGYICNIFSLVFVGLYVLLYCWGIVRGRDKDEESQEFTATNSRQQINKPNKRQEPYEADPHDRGGYNDGFPADDGFRPGGGQQFAQDDWGHTDSSKLNGTDPKMQVQRLQARVKELEAENAQLRSSGGGAKNYGSNYQAPSPASPQKAKVYDGPSDGIYGNETGGNAFGKSGGAVYGDNQGAWG